MPKRGQKKYSEEALKEAVHAVRNGMGLNEAARRYGVPKATVAFRKSLPLDSPVTMGPCPVLGKEESVLVKWIFDCHKKGLPRRRDDVLDSDHIHEAITKDMVAPLLQKALSKAVKTATLKNGFKATRLFPWNPDAIDYSKCIGSNKMNEDISRNSSTLCVVDDKSTQKVLSYDRFRNIVGENIILTLAAMEEAGHAVPKEEASSSELLLAIYKELRPGALTVTTPSTSSSAAEVSTSCNAKNGNEVNSDPDGSKLPSIHRNCPPADVSDSALANSLTWPESPKRKSKRNTERLPFVITSKQWQNIAVAKSEKRKAENEAKEERKRLRVEKKRQKEEEKNNKIAGRRYRPIRGRKV